MIISRFMDILLQVSKYSVQFDTGVYDTDCISVETDRCEGVGQEQGGGGDRGEGRQAGQGEETREGGQDQREEL